jgi:hypothetical protein
MQDFSVEVNKADRSLLVTKDGVFPTCVGMNRKFSFNEVPRREIIYPVYLQKYLALNDIV